MSPVRGSPLEALAGRLDAAGLLWRGAFHPRPEDGVPDLEDGRPARSLVLIGNAGPELWRRLQCAPEATVADSFDSYCRRVLGTLAHELGARALFPADGPPWWPFQRWAMRAEPGLRPSPLGILIHPAYGLWHAYRGALLFAARLPLPRAVPQPPPCDRCSGHPCLSACPAGALGAAGYDVERCRNHLTDDPDGPCMRRGCLARHACPIGRPYAYDPDQAAHHMRAFVTPQADRARRESALGRRDSVRRRRPVKPSPARRD